MIDQANVHHTAFVDIKAVLGMNIKIGANAYIGPNVFLGDNCQVDSGAVLGARQFELSISAAELFPIEIATNAFIGSNVTIQYGIKGPTRIGADSWVNHNSAIGHDVHMGEHVHVGLCCSISGYSKIGNHVKIGASSTLTNRSVIGNHARIGIGSLVLHPVEAGTTVLGRPAELRTQHLEARKRMHALLGIARKTRRITGGGSRIGRYLPIRLKNFIKHLLWK